MVNTAFPKGGVHGINTAFKGDSHCPQSLFYHAHAGHFLHIPAPIKKRGGGGGGGG